MSAEEIKKVLYDYSIKVTALDGTNLGAVAEVNFSDIANRIAAQSSTPAGEDVEHYEYATNALKAIAFGSTYDKNECIQIAQSTLKNLTEAALQNKVPVENIDYPMSIVIWNNARNMSQKEFTKWYTKHTK